MAGAAQSNVPFRQGAPFTVGMSIANNGRFTVRVLAVTGNPSFGFLPLSNRRLLVSGPTPKNAGHWVRPSRTFRPFNLPPGNVMFVQLNGTYKARCHPAKNSGGYSQVFGGFEVRYSFLWRTANARVDLPDTLSIDFPAKEDCSWGSL